jgi:hypothetical protein
MRFSEVRNGVGPWIFTSDNVLVVDHQLDTVPLITVAVFGSANGVYVLYPDQRDACVPVELIETLVRPEQIVNGLCSPGALCKIAKHYGGKVSDHTLRFHMRNFSEWVNRTTESRYEPSQNDGLS